MQQKYVTFSPWFAGMCNVLMSYEVALSIAYITKRTLVLPPSAFMGTISTEPNIHKFVDMWEVLHRPNVEREFSVVDFDDVPELYVVKDYMKQVLSSSKSVASHTNKIAEYVPDLFEFKTEPPTVYSHHPKPVNELHISFVNGIPNTHDYEIFAGERPTVDLNRPEKFIHFENCLFGHYFYHAYCDRSNRNELKNKMAKAMRYKAVYFYIAKDVSKKIGKYNALHIRRNDFSSQFGTQIEIINTGEKLLDQINKFENFKGLPLYIATDESDNNFFNALKDKYDLYFYDDFGFDLTPLEKAIVEQIICSNAEFFIGTKPSTYSARINRMRGEINKQSDDYMGINLLMDRPAHMDSAIPWADTENKVWHWDHSTHPHWVKE